MKLKLFRLMAEQDGDGGDSGTGPSGGDAIGTGNDARIALLNSIGDSNDSLRSEDLADINDDGSTTPFSVDDEDAEAVAAREEAATEAARLAAEQEDTAAPTTQMITRKVNGKDVTLPLEEWLVRAQKVEAADEYLQDAARQRKELQRNDQQPAPAPVVKQGPSAEEIAAQQNVERRALARAIQMGTEEEAVAALERLQNMVKTPTLTVEDVGRVADERLKFNSAIKWFSDEYKDLTSNPQLYNMVVQHEAALVQQGDKRPYAERYKAVGDAVRVWRDNLISSVKPEPSTTNPPIASLDAKRAAKAAAPKAPTSASTKAAPVTQEEEDESPSAVIAAMAKSRGGPQWARG